MLSVWHVHLPLHGPCLTQSSISVTRASPVRPPTWRDSCIPGAGPSIMYPAHQPAAASLFERARALYVLSDYPAANLTVDGQEAIVRQVAAGAGLLHDWRMGFLPR